MAARMRQSTRMGWYLMRQRLAKREKFPLIVELEPLFQCNLECAGCGKIQHPDHVLRRRMSVEQAVGAIEESGTPMVSIAGGEPLIHPEIHLIAAELVKRKRFVYLCTNALLLERKLENFKPSPYFAWAIHMDGLRERHDASVEREGVFDKAVSAIRAAQARGLQGDHQHHVLHARFPEDGAGGARLPQRRPRGRRDDDLSRRTPMRKRPTRSTSSGVRQTRELFGEAFADGRRKRWRLNHSPLFLDFLEGKAEFDCTAWGIPSYSLFGWQRPCYLMSDGYAKTYKELIETTDWSKYGRGRDPRCENCMAHCGYEPTAVLRTTHSLRQSLRALVN